MYSAYKLNKQGDNIQPWHTPFPIWNQSLHFSSSTYKISSDFPEAKRDTYNILKPSLKIKNSCFLTTKIIYFIWSNLIACEKDLWMRRMGGFNFVLEIYLLYHLWWDNQNSKWLYGEFQKLSSRPGGNFKGPNYDRLSEPKSHISGCLCHWDTDSQNERTQNQEWSEELRSRWPKNGAEQGVW